MKFMVGTLRDYIIDKLEAGQQKLIFGHHKTVLGNICDLLHQKVKVLHYT